jgi:hypothetical protein
MAILRLTNNEMPGAAAVSRWLQQLIEEEGMDRPTFKVIAQYIVSDLHDAVLEESSEDEQGIPFILGDFLGTPPKLPNIMDLKGQIL